jgi:hypothetical protein
MYFYLCFACLIYCLWIRKTRNKTCRACKILFLFFFINKFSTVCQMSPFILKYFLDQPLPNVAQSSLHWSLKKKIVWSFPATFFETVPRCNSVGLLRQKLSYLPTCWIN